jgi:PAS domain S-box-containing protein
MKLRSHLITLVVVALVPVLVFAGVMVVFIGNEREQALKDNLLEVARALSLAIDRELLVSIRTLEALATSQHLDSGDLRKFYEQAKRVLGAHRTWDNMLLVDLSGQQLVNLRRPFGSPLPRSGAPEMIQQVSETGQPAVSNLFWGYLAQRHLLGVDVPVIRNGKVRYVLTASSSPELLTKLLLQQSSSPDWRATVIDRNKIIIARTPDVEQFLGKPATALFAAKSGEGQETTWRGITHEGIDVYTGLHRSELSGWTMGVALPASLIESRKRNVLAGLVGGGTLLLLVGAALAFVFGRRIAKAITALSASAAALGRGEIPHPVASAITETNQVAQAIEDSAVKRKQTEEELRKTTQTLKALIQASPVAIDILDLDGKVKMWNPAAEKLFGWSEEEVVGRSFPHVPKDKQDEFGEIFKSVLQGNSLTDMETRRQKKDGSLIDVSISTAPIRNADGNIIGSVGMLTDITERKQARGKLKNSREQLRALAAHLQTVREEERKKIARELHDESSQLLASVHIGLSEMEREWPSASQKKLDEVKDLLTQIEEQLRNLSHELYPNILDDLGLLPALQFLAGKVSARTGIRINLEGSPNGRLRPSIDLTFYRTVQEALNNVVRHAKATMVTVRLLEADGLVHCSIQDDGVGFDVLTVLGHTPGESLGLVAIRERVGTLGGTMKIHSAPNQGTELHVTIPIER